MIRGNSPMKKRKLKKKNEKKENNKTVMHEYQKESKGGTIS